MVIGPSSPPARHDRKPSRPVRLAVMTSDADSNPEDEYADDEYADHDAEDREEPLAPTEIPFGAPEGDVLEQHQDVARPADWTPLEIPDDAPEDDVLEQHREVPYDDEEE